MKKLLLVVAFALYSLCNFANKTINVETAGTLASLVGSEKLTITDLVITGNLNGDDIKTLREMAGIMVSGGPSKGTLAKLDMTNANIVTGGGYYMYDYNTYENLYTENDKMGKYMFYNCPALQSITIPKTVKAMGQNVFSVCANLKEINVPNENNYFYSVDGVLFGKEDFRLIKFAQARTETEYVVPNGVKIIGYEAFSSCILLTKISFPNTLTDIEGAAFAFCKGLTTVDLPESLERFKSSSFNYCKNLEAINIPTSSKFFTSENGVLFDKNKETLVRCPQKKKGEYIIPSTVTTLGDYAFDSCIEITSLKMPEGLKTLEEWAVSGCISLKSLLIPSSVETFGKGVFSDCKNITSVNIPNGISQLPKWLFNACEKLTEITIPNSVKIINEGVFYNCKQIKFIEIPNGVTEIEPNTFNSCVTLEELILPESMSKIGQYALMGCKGLKTFKILSATPPACGMFPFFGIDQENCTLFVVKGTKDIYQADNNYKDFKKIEELEDSSIENTTNTFNNIKDVYSIDGKRINKNIKGLQIIRMSDGSTRKVYIK